MNWTTAAASSGSNCAQAARDPDGLILLRHSKHPDGPTLVFTPDEWQALLTGARAGNFDHLLDQ